MQQPIIPIGRASEDLIHALIAAGVLEVTAGGLKCKENRSPHRPKHETY